MLSAVCEGNTWCTCMDGIFITTEILNSGCLYKYHKQSLNQLSKYFLYGKIKRILPKYVFEMLSVN